MLMMRVTNQCSLFVFYRYYVSSELGRLGMVTLATLPELPTTFLSVATEIFLNFTTNFLCVTPAVIKLL